MSDLKIKTNSHKFTTKKLSRRSITIASKLEVLRRARAGERAIDIGRSLELPASTIRTIVKNNDKIEKSAKNEYVRCLSRIRLLPGKENIMEKMENLLIEWIQEMNLRHEPVNSSQIKNKAIFYFQELKKNSTLLNNDVFKASNGWFHRFKKRCSLLQETQRKAAATTNTSMVTKNTTVHSAFPFELKLIIELGSYNQKQVFNIVETGLYWKKLPSRTYLPSEKASSSIITKERVTLLLGANAEGDAKLKPLLLYHIENPVDLKGYTKAHLPVLWRSHKALKITPLLFQDWLSSYFSPFVKEYCKAQNLYNKALLIVDKASYHPSNVEDLADNVQVMYMPHDESSSCQPMDQGVVSAFRAYYLLRIIQQILSETNGEHTVSVAEYWQNYSIKRAIENIAASWNDVTQLTMNTAWWNIWPESVHSKYADTSEPETHLKIVEMAQQAGFSNIDQRDVVDMLQSHNIELTPSELAELKKLNEREKVLAENTKEDVRELTETRMSEAFSYFQKGAAILTHDDPNMERSGKFNHGLNELLKHYHELFEEKKQRLINNKNQTY